MSSIKTHGGAIFVFFVHLLFLKYEVTPKYIKVKLVKMNDQIGKIDSSGSQP